MREHIEALRLEARSKEVGEIIEYRVENPDLKGATSYKSWLDMAEYIYCRFLTPQYIDKETVVLRYQKLDVEESFHTHKVLNESEKYGVDSKFAGIDKTAYSSFMFYYLNALKAVNIAQRHSVLNLGINRGDEFAVIEEMLSPDVFKEIEFVGVDYAQSAIDMAKERFKSKNVQLFCHDINTLETLGLSKTDLFISIGTLQSVQSNFKTLFMELVQRYVSEKGAIILGFTNCRWIDNEMIYGAKVKNRAFSELSLVIKDIHFCKKYLQQKKFDVTVSGKDYIFLTATKL